MRTFMFLYLVAATSGQYNYSLQSDNTVRENVSGHDNSDDYSKAASDIFNRRSEDDAYREEYSGLTEDNKFHKDYFTFHADDHEFDDRKLAEKVAGTLKGNLRVAFIKNPENSALENTALHLLKSAGNKHTVIYVLSKPIDIEGLGKKFKELNKSNYNKPEVHFVKYRTPAEAENAQRIIQSQYDALPGTSSTFNSAVAPLLSVSSGDAILLNGLVRNEDLSRPDNSYIPPKFSYLPPKRRF